MWWYWTAASLRFSQRRAGERICGIFTSLRFSQRRAGERIGEAAASLLAETRAKEDE